MTAPSRRRAGRPGPATDGTRRGSCPVLVQVSVVVRLRIADCCVVELCRWLSTADVRRRPRQCREIQHALTNTLSRADGTGRASDPDMQTASKQALRCIITGQRVARHTAICRSFSLRCSISSHCQQSILDPCSSPTCMTMSGLNSELIQRGVQSSNGSKSRPRSKSIFHSFPPSLVPFLRPSFHHLHAPLFSKRQQ